MFYKKHHSGAIIGLALIVFCLLVLAEVSFAADGQLNQKPWAELLKKYVHNGVVDYAGFQRDETTLDRYLENLAAQTPEQLSRNAQYAFYVNAYNAWTVKMILSAYPGIKSIKDLGGFFKSPWEKPIVRVGTQTFTLDEIEHKKLRPRFKDPRIHFVVNCASISCPPLRSEPYDAKKLEAQLDDATRAFLNNPVNYRLEGSNFYVSRLFKWYSEDFEDDAVGFYLKYAREDLKADIQAAGSALTVKYLNYDWRLNGK